MGRNLKRNADYFPHSIHIRKERAVRTLQLEHGNIALYYMYGLFEMLTEANDQRIEINENEIVFICNDLNCTYVDFEPSFKAMVKYGILNYENNILSSDYIDNILEPLKKERVRKNEFAKKQKEKKIDKKAPEIILDVENKIIDVENPVLDYKSKEEYRKEEKSKEKKRKEEKREEKEKEETQDSVVQKVHLKKDVSVFYKNIEFLGISQKNEEKVFKCFLNWVLEQGHDIHKEKTIAQFEILLNEFLNAHMMFFRKLKASEISENMFTPPYEPGVMTTNDYVSASGVL